MKLCLDQLPLVIQCISEVGTGLEHARKVGMILLGGQSLKLSMVFPGEEPGIE